MTHSGLTSPGIECLREGREEAFGTWASGGDIAIHDQVAVPLALYIPGVFSTLKLKTSLHQNWCSEEGEANLKTSKPQNHSEVSENVV